MHSYINVCLRVTYVHMKFSSSVCRKKKKMNAAHFKKKILFMNHLKPWYFILKVKYCGYVWNSKCNVCGSCYCENAHLAKFHFCNPQNPNIFSHTILVPDPISNLMPYLNSSWNFLSENVYFWYGRAKIFQVKLSWSSRGAKFSETGDVTLRVASSKRMAIYTCTIFYFSARIICYNQFQ